MKYALIARKAECDTPENHLSVKDIKQMEECSDEGAFCKRGTKKTVEHF